MKEDTIMYLVLAVLLGVNLALSVNHTFNNRYKHHPYNDSNECFCGCNSRSVVPTSIFGSWANKVGNVLKFNQDATGNNSSMGKFNFTYSPSDLTGLIDGSIKFHIDGNTGILYVTDPQRGDVAYTRQ